MAEGIPIFGRVPLAAPKGFAAWSLLDLILMLVGIVAAIVMIILVLKNRKREKDEEDFTYVEDEEEEKKKIRVPWMILSIILAIVSLILFLITQDMRLPMFWVDEWTIAFVLILVIELIGTRLTFNKKKENEEAAEV
jgi:heme/copper-type cytochrome/quinol oxidase subunit 2